MMDDQRFGELLEIFGHAQVAWERAETAYKAGELDAWRDARQEHEAHCAHYKRVLNNALVN